MQYATFWSRDCRFNPEYREIKFPFGKGKPADASLPYLEGTGWYKKKINIPENWKNRGIKLNIGGVVLEAWVWVNREHAGYHRGHQTPFSFKIDDWVEPGEENEIIIAVNNAKYDRSSTFLRGFKGNSGGIYKSVNLELTGNSSIEDFYDYPGKDRKKLNWQVYIEESFKKGTKLDWIIEDKESEKEVARGIREVNSNIISWETGTFNMKMWSDKNPHLYKIKLKLKKKKIMDVKTQQFTHAGTGCG